MRVRVAAVAGDGVDRLDLLGAELEQEPLGLGDDLVLADAGAQQRVDLLVDRVDDRGGVVEQRDLVLGLDLARGQHHRLGVADRDAQALQREERLHVGEVDARAARSRARARAAPRRRGRPAGRARRSPAASRRASGDAGAPARLGQPRRVELVVLGGRAEVPEHRIALARQQHAARALVARPLADVGARDVADVVLVEQQHRAEARMPAAPRAPSPGGRCAAARSRPAAPSRPPSWRRVRRSSVGSCSRRWRSVTVNVYRRTVKDSTYRYQVGGWAAGQAVRTGTVNASPPAARPGSPSRG